MKRFRWLRQNIACDNGSHSLERRWYYSASPKGVGPVTSSANFRHAGKYFIGTVVGPDTHVAARGKAAILRLKSEKALIAGSMVDYWAANGRQHKTWDGTVHVQRG